jgi:hypothetical protein
VGSVWHIGCVEHGDELQGQDSEVLEVPPGLKLIDKTAKKTSESTVVKKSRRQKRRYLFVPQKNLKPMEIIKEEKEEDENPAVDICVVGRQAEITVDSAAEASVCPRDWGEEFGLVEVPEKNKLRLINASGGSIPHHGSRETVFKTRVTSRDNGAEEKLMSMGFEVCEVKKALAAVWKICEKGNLVQFGFLEGESFITNKKTGDKVFMKRKGGSYVLDVDFSDPGF